jgi:glycosyltransferase involved in cell wall biosynthesis
LTARSLVTVLTPVYNGEAYLAECIGSVLGQTYPHWEYVLVDNASTDGTGEILRAYAAQDRRLRIVTNPRVVPVMENHNIAARQLSPDSRWCKFLSADDALLPECLERMVELGDSDPCIGLVSAYQLQGTGVGLGGVSGSSPVMPGHLVARQSLLGLLSVFGGPTAHMIRADLVRRRDPFYDESDIHADTAACYDILRQGAFGFVHEVLTYARAHHGSITFSVARRLNTYLLGHLRILKTYGPVFLSDEEYGQVLEQRLAAYDRFLARALLAPGGREIWRYHCAGLRELGFPVSRARLTRALLRQMRKIVTSPRTELPKVVRFLNARDGDDTSWHHWWAPTGFEAVKPLTTHRSH